MGEDDFYDPMSGYDMSADFADAGDVYAGGGVAGVPDFTGGGYSIPSWGVNPRIMGGLVGNPGRLMRGAGGMMVRGARMGMQKVWAATKKFGPELVAGAVGMSALELVQALLDSGVMTRRPRRRGISSRDIRCAKRVVRFTNRMVHELGCVHTPRVHARGVRKR